MVPHRGAWVDVDVAVEAIGCCSDADAAGDLVLSESAGGVGGHAGLAAWDGGFEAKRLHHDCVEDGEAVELL